MNRLPDFKVSCKFIPQAEGGRLQTPYQGYRSDLHYEGEDIQKDGIYMIWPEFLNPNGSVILEDKAHVPASGEAFMWIVNDKMRDYHRSAATVGRRCWFMEGVRKVAEAVIVERLGLIED